MLCICLSLFCISFPIFLHPSLFNYIIQNNPHNSPMKYQRNHSFSKHPSLAQICGILVFLIQALIFYIYIVGTYQNTSLRISMICIFTISLGGLLIFALITGQIDSTDEVLIAIKNKNIIANLESHKLRACKVCRCNVKETSRHCSQCQRCCEQLDHHCIWLNTCIGSKNYKQFIITTNFAFLTLVIYLLSLSLLTEQLSRTTMNFKCFGFVIAWIVALVVIVFMVLIFNLILFHIYINCNQISTYDFVLMKKLSQKKGNSITPITNEGADVKATSQNPINQTIQPIQQLQPQSHTIIMASNETTKSKQQHYSYSILSQPLPQPNIFLSQPLRNTGRIQTLYECKSQSDIKNHNYASTFQKINNKKDQLSIFFSKNPSLNLFLGSKQCKQSLDEMITIFNSRNSKPKHQQDIINT